MDALFSSPDMWTDQKFHIMKPWMENRVGSVALMLPRSGVGPAAMECVQRYNTDVAVIGAAGVSVRRGITDLDDEEAGVIRAVLEKTERIIVLADGSKFGDVALSTVVPINRVSVIVTDTGADPVEVERIAAEGVEVILVNPTRRRAR